jgi:hypothetical protein
MLLKYRVSITTTIFDGANRDGMFGLYLDLKSRQVIRSVKSLLACVNAPVAH